MPPTTCAPAGRRGHKMVYDAGRGRVVLFGGCPPGTRVELDTYRLHYDGVTIASPFHFRPRDVARARELLLRPDVDWSRFITSRASLDETPAVFARLADGDDVKCAILPGLPGPPASSGT